MSAVKQCPKCSQPMQLGFVADKTRGSVDVGHWYEGAPKLTFLNGVKIDAVPSLPVGAYRCTGCGLLEFYALAEHAAQR